MVKIKDISKIGLGTYRMGVNFSEHNEAFNYAIESGINIIDTSSNYSFGNSELLVGKNISTQIRDSVFIVSKAGYIQGQDLERIKSIKNLNFRKISDTFLYSLDKDFLAFQLNQSLKRLSTEYIDCYLIHNPEYYITENSNLSISNLREIILNAFSFLEEKVKMGVIRYYGISSNNISVLKEILKFKDRFTNFKFIQFPYNIIEQNSLFNNSEIDKLNVQELKNHGLTVLSNRPLNTIYKGEVLRLSDMFIEDLNTAIEKEYFLFNSFKNIIVKRLFELNEDTKLENYYPINFFIESRKRIANEEAIEKAIQLHLLPFLKALDLQNKVSIDLLCDLKYYWALFSKSYNQERLEVLKEKLIEKNIIQYNDKRDFSVILVEHYLNIGGIDSVLMGLTKKKYVDKIKFFL